MDWYEKSCKNLGGNTINFCKIENKAEKPSKICYVSKFNYFTLEDNPKLQKRSIDTKPKVKRWWIILLTIMVISIIIAYPRAYWNTFNAVFYEMTVFIFIIYGQRISRSWNVLTIIIGVVGSIYVIMITTLLLATGIWYPHWADILAHTLAGFALYTASTILFPKKNALFNILFGLFLGVLYEILEFICFSAFHIPNLEWNMVNTYFDLGNHTVGSLLAILIEVLVRNHKHNYYISAIKNVKCLK